MLIKLVVKTRDISTKFKMDGFVEIARDVTQDAGMGYVIIIIFESRNTPGTT